ncbi:hypothetical protein Hgul01_00805 [Herpetosiphon gulosus]|uniref:Uncharacterized protein n=1 Tax=Herpetosiphon gulosus TaxID=1973496 RepID=A0ABP9WWR7_9CHLR
MTLQRMDNVLIVVNDLTAAKGVFIELGMELEGEMPLAGLWVDQVVGLENVQCDRDCQVDCVFRPITPESVRQSEWPIGCESVPSLAA